MEFFKPGIRVGFMSKRKPLMTMSLFLVVASWVLVFTKGLNFGIDFAGGTEALLNYKDTQDEAKIAATIERTGLEKPDIVTYGLTDEGRYFVRSRTQSLLTDEQKAKVESTFKAKFGEPKLWDTTDESGEEIRVRYNEAQDMEAMKATLGEAGFPKGVVLKQTEANNPIYILRLPGVRQRITEAAQEDFGEAFIGIDRLESVGSAVGKQLRNQGTLAVIYALIGILLYISFRFDMRYSPGAVFALVHDVSITVGLFSLFGIEFNLPIIAALLAIVGYSLNDTIVVYDRIRESLRDGLGDTLVESIDISISDCLSRTVLTSVTTFLAVLSIYIYGGGIIQNFAFAMLIGVVVGTYSSIFIASPVVLFMDAYLAKRAENQPVRTAAASRP